MEARTHQAIDRRWSGVPVELRGGSAVVRLDTLPEMAVDGQGLVHGGFLFALADHAAMLAVNEPFVVLAAATVELLRPVRVGESLTARAEVTGERGRRREVRCVVEGAAGVVMRGELRCAVLERHVLEPPAAEKGGGG